MPGNPNESENVIKIIRCKTITTTKLCSFLPMSIDFNIGLTLYRFLITRSKK